MNTDQHRFYPRFIVTVIFVCCINSSCFLSGSMPLSVKNFLETADKLELIADAKKQDGTIVYNGDMIKNESLIATITDDETKKYIVNSVDKDFGGLGDTVCFLPNHILKATKGEKVVEVEICYQCMRYEIKGSLGEYNGGLDLTWSESVLNKILFEKGIEIK